MLRRPGRLAIALFVLSVFATPARPDTLVDRFSAVTANLNIGTGEGTKQDSVKVDVIRWSTDKERDDLAAALMKGEMEFAEAVKKQPAVGYFWTSASVGFTVRYAYRVQTPAMERVILVLDGRPHSGGPEPWSIVPKTDTPERPFTVVEMRIAPKLGEGKMSLAAGVAVDGEAKTVALDNYMGAPVILRNVKHEAVPKTS